MDRVPSLCSSSPPAARETFLLEIFSLMAFAISIILFSLSFRSLCNIVRSIWKPFMCKGQYDHIGGDLCLHRV